MVVGSLLPFNYVWIVLTSAISCFSLFSLLYPDIRGLSGKSVDTVDNLIFFDIFIIKNLSLERKFHLQFTDVKIPNILYGHRLQCNIINIHYVNSGAGLRRQRRHLQTRKIRVSFSSDLPCNSFSTCTGKNNYSFSKYTPALSTHFRCRITHLANTSWKYCESRPLTIRCTCRIRSGTDSWRTPRNSFFIRGKISLSNALYHL